MSKKIHCHHCGGFIGDEARDVAYRLPTDTVLLAAPRNGLCPCEPPILYQAPPGFLSSPGMPSVVRGEP